MGNEIRVDEAARVDGSKQSGVGKATGVAGNMRSNEGKAAEASDDVQSKGGKTTKFADNMRSNDGKTAGIDGSRKPEAGKTTESTDNAGSRGGENAETATTVAAATANITGAADATTAATTTAGATIAAADVEGENHGGAVEGAAAELVESGGGDSNEPGNGPDIETLVAEAERRGYIRGRNERIEELMAEPGVWEQPESQPEILSRHRRSIWD